MNAPKFHPTVVTFAVENNSNLDSQFDRYAEILDLTHIPLSPQVTDIFGTDRSFAILLRPDNYIGVIATYPWIDPVKNYIDRQIYLKFNDWLIDYDRETMDEYFKDN